jgi:hypothetical protein
MQTNITKGLMEALAKWQKVKPSVDLDGSNPHFKSKYATLANIIKTVQPILADCGLTYIQLVAGNEIRTLLMHPESEGCVVSERPIPDLSKVQDEGSFITYQKRYQLSALLGIATDSDNDGQGVAKEKVSALPRATEAQIKNAIEKGIAAGNKQTIDTMVAKYTLDSSQLRRLVLAEIEYFDDRIVEVLVLLQGMGYLIEKP